MTTENQPYTQAPESTPSWRRSPAFRFVDTYFHVAISVIALLWAAGLATNLGLLVYTEQVLAALTMFAVAVAFITIDRRGQPRSAPVPWYDWILCITALMIFGYVAFDYPRLAENIYLSPRESFIVSMIMLPLIIEILRRTTGWALLTVFLCFFVYAMFADLVPGTLQGRAQDFYRLMPLLGLDGTALFGTPLAIVVTVVLAFIFMGQLLFASGGGDFFTDVAAGLMGRTRGGSAKIAVVASAFFGSISGSVIANVTSTGVITIPMMKRSGFSAKVAAAVEATASNGGQIMPPIMGAAAFIMADFLGVSYGAVLMAALIPALLYFFAVLVQVDLEAAKRGVKAVDASQLPRVRDVMRKGWMFLMPFVVLLVCMFNLNMPPEKAAIYASVVLIVLGAALPYEGKRITLKVIWEALIGTGRTAVQIAVICGVAGMIIGVLNITGLGFSLGLLLLNVGQGNLLILLSLTAFVCVILGMSMPTTSLYILLSTLAAPALIELGTTPMAAHLFVLYFGIVSFITPPVCFASFAAANIAGSPPMATGFTSVRLSWIAYVVPFLFVYSPALLLQGDWLSITLALATSVPGIWLASCGMVGIMFTPLKPLLRVLTLISGLALFLPPDIFHGAAFINIAGGVIGTLIVVLELKGKRNDGPPLTMAPADGR